MRTETDVLLSVQRAVAAAFPDFTEILTELEHESPERPFAVVSADGDGAASGTHSSRWFTLPVTVSAYVKGTTRKAARKAAEDAREALVQAFELGPVPRHVPLFDYTGRPAVQRVTLRGVTGGALALDVGGEVTDLLDWRAQPVDVREAVEDLPGVGSGNLIVFGKAGGPWTLRFDGARRGEPVDPVIVEEGGLIGPAAEAVVEVLSVGNPEPWRDPRDYVRLDQVALGGLRDPADPNLRTVTCGLRCTWGRAGHVALPEMTFTGITARAR